MTTRTWACWGFAALRAGVIAAIAAAGTLSFDIHAAEPARAWVAAPGARLQVEFTSTGIPFVRAVNGSSAGAGAGSEPIAGSAGAANNWIAVDPAAAARVQFTNDGLPFVPPLDATSAVVQRATAAPIERIVAPGSFADVQFTSDGVPFVPPVAAAPDSGLRVSATEAITPDNRVIKAPVAAPAAGFGTRGGLSPSTVNYGSVPINTTASANVTITYDAGYFVFSAGGSGLNPPFGFSFGTCTGAPGPGTCTATETFHPTAAGPATGSITITECPTAGGACIGFPLNLQGTGVSAAFANPSTVDYGNVPVGATASRDVTIEYDAGYFVFSAGGSGLNPPFNFAFGTCTTAPGPGTCTVTETFHPTAVGPATGSIVISECPTAGGACIGIPVNFQGFGGSGSATPSTVDFGNVPVNTTASRDVTIAYDAGYFVFSAGGAGLNPPFGFSFGTCTGAPGPGTCTITESFHPTALGLATGSIVISQCPTAGGACIGIPLSIQGFGGSASAVPSTIDFGNVQLNAATTGNAVITVDAGYFIAGAGGVSGLNPPFGFSFGTCVGPFTGPGHCTITESFQPSAIGPASGSVLPFECPTAGGACVSIPVNLQGFGVLVGPPLFQSAVSRRVHGGAGTFDLPLSAVPTAPTTEPRQGPAQNIVFTFDKPANAATATVTEGSATAGAPAFSGNEVIVGLTGVGNQQYVTVSLAGVGSSDGGSGGNASVRVGFLAGDVNQTRVVSVADLGLVNAQLSQPVTVANFLKDVNVSGAISIADKGLTNANLTKALPAP